MIWLVIGIVVICVMMIIFYLKIRRYYINKQYILMEVDNNKNRKIIRGNYVEITYNEDFIHIEKDVNDHWHYVLNNEGEKELRYGEHVKVGEKEFKIIVKEKRGGLYVLLPLIIIMFTSFILLGQGYILVKSEIVDDANISHEEAESSSENIYNNTNEEIEDVKVENKESDEEVKNIIADEKNKDMHTVVLENDELFQESISIDWEDYDEGERERRFLNNISSEIGINVSFYQKDIDWGEVKADGIDFAIIHVGSRGYELGKIKLDSKFKENIDGAVANNIKIGVYFYSQAINQEEMNEEIEVILNAVKGYELDYPIGIQLDCQENYRTYELSTEEQQEKYIDLVKYFCIRMREKGYIPMIYGKYEWFEQFPEKTFDGYFKWVYNADSAPSNIDNCIIWQYKEKAQEVINGIDSKLYVSINLSAYVHEKKDNNELRSVK